MTREIKFRAWDKESSTMIYPGEFSHDEFYLECCDGTPFLMSAPNDDNDGFNHPEHRKESVVMQFVGLRNEGGKELYEGDIVSIEHIYYQGVAQYDSRLEEGFRKIGKYVLKYDEGRFVFSNGLNSLEIHKFWRWSQEKQFYYATGDFVRENDRYGHFSKEYFRFLELAGNKFENPELLER